MRENSSALKNLWRRGTLPTNTYASPACVPYVRRCVRFYGHKWGWIPPQENMRRLGGVFAAFSPGHSRSKILQDKARYRFDRRASTKSRNAGLFRLSGKVHIFKKLKNLSEPRATKCPCFKGFGGSPIFCGGDDGNKHRKRKTHSAGACSLIESAERNCRSARSRLVIVRMITMILKIIRRWSNKKETVSHSSPWIQLCCSASTIARQ